MTEMIALSTIVAADDAQMRAAGTDAAIVGEYMEALEAGAVLPPIIVYRNGEDRCHVADGFHRVEAAKKLGRTEIVADVRHGTLRDAIMHAAGANASHGVRRTNADKRRAVMTLLNDRQWSKWSDRKIGEACKVDHKTVAAIRREMDGEIPIPTKSRAKPNGEIPTPVGGSMVAKLFATISDEALVAECRRRGLEVA